MDLFTYTAFELDRRRAARLDRDNAHLRAQRERRLAEPDPHAAARAVVISPAPPDRAAAPASERARGATI